MDISVSIAPCEDYSEKEIHKALNNLLKPLGGLDFITPETTVVIKTNLVSAMKPETAAVTHPKLICELTRMLVSKGARVIIGDSPGGPYNAVYMGRVYSASGIREAEKYGAVLNDDFGQSEAVFENARVLKSFVYTSYLDKADVIIDFCKLKSHGMMAMSAAAKNMFGAIPGLTKPEYHYRFPDHSEFADMLVDIDEYFSGKIKLCIVDAVVAMEGNGPTQGKPKKVGALIASANPHAADLLCSKLIGVSSDEIPTLSAAYKRGLIPKSAEELNIFGDYLPFVKKDFEIITSVHKVTFNGAGNSRILNAFSRFAGGILKTEPRLKASQCVGCNACGNICPANAIEIIDKKAVIDRSKCIRCFCCQEFCPKGAMKVHKNILGRLVSKI